MHSKETFKKIFLQIQQLKKRLKVVLKILRDFSFLQFMLLTTQCLYFIFWKCLNGLETSALH